MVETSERSVKRDVAFAIFAIAVIVGTSILGQIATYPNLAPWYADLLKPSFNPANWLFAPVWSTLYMLMAFALWRILRSPPGTAGRASALALFFLQLALNAAWSWMFFWAHSPLLGLVNIVPQLACVLATLVAFVRVDKWAARCIAPLAVWVAYACVLNFSIWWLNG